MKKIFSVLLCLALIAVSFSTKSFAAETNSSVKDNNVIREIFIHSTYQGRSDDGAYIFTSTYNPESNSMSKSTLQKSQTSFSILPLNDTEEQIVNGIISSPAKSGGNNYAYIWDSTYSVKVFSTVYYTNISEQYANYCHLDKITGGYELSDHTVRVQSQSVTYGINDIFVSYHDTVSKTEKNWTITPPSSWPSINISQEYVRTLGANTTVSIVRNSTPWTVTLHNYVYGEISIG